MLPKEAADRSLVISYVTLRRAVGVIGMALPFMLIIGKWALEGPGIELSMSGYYYTIMRNVFVGSLCAIGVFMLSYRGPERMDDIAGDISAFFAVLTALVPTSPALDATPTQTLVGNFHLAFAACLFGTLAFFSLYLFRKTDPTKPPTSQKLKRNVVYAVCGLVMVFCILAIIALRLLPDEFTSGLHAPVFWLEATAIIAFGVSWLVKGEAVFKDKEAD